jgi:hypothetical protein
MDEETKKRFPKEFSILKTKNSLIKEPAYLDDSCAPLGIGLPDIYKKMENERYSFPKIEDIQKRIDILKTQENVDPNTIELLEEMKKASEAQIRADLDPMEEIKGFKSVHDIVRDEQNAIINGIQQTLSNESMQIINKQIELDPKIFRSKYPELFDYVISLKD